MGPAGNDHSHHVLRQFQKPVYVIELNDGKWNLIATYGPNT
jgi:hypothetical protein